MVFVVKPLAKISTSVWRFTVRWYNRILNKHSFGDIVTFIIKYNNCVKHYFVNFVFFVQSVVSCSLCDT